MNDLMKHFLDTRHLSAQSIRHLIERAQFFKNHGNYPSYPSETVANLFYENSTRTRISFELAANRLGMSVVNVDIINSSERKGECIEDTLNTLTAMGIHLFVIRHQDDGLPQRLTQVCGEGVHIVNAGDGQHAHPSQALLDFMTIVEDKPDLSSLKITIVGDIRHSRVANSLQDVCATLGVGELSLVAPIPWQPQEVHYGRITTSLNDGLHDADVVICLRVQHERLNRDERLSLDTYRQNYTLTSSRLRLAKSDAIVMHPGPINRGVEIDSDVADGVQSRILAQVCNGVFMRMAILEALISIP